MTVSIRFFGQSSLTLNAQTTTLNGKAALLLGILARERRAVERAWLGELLHPNSKSARKNLTVTLVRLQKTIGYDLIEVTPETLFLRHDADVWIDCWEWARQANALRQRDNEDREALIRQLRQLVQLYRGAFLEKLDPANNLAAYNWLLVERARFEREYIAVVEQLLRLYRLQERNDAIIELITSALAHVPLHESFYIDYMRTKTRQGKAAEARRWGQQQKLRLKQKLNYEPSELFDSFFEETSERGSHRTSKRRAASQFLAPQSTKVIFGRKLQANTIANQLLHHDARLITLLGMGGIGKTILAIETAAIVQPVFRNGVLWVSFADLLTEIDANTATEQIATRLASALDLELSQDHNEITKRIIVQLSKYKLLLILDNFESVITGATFVNTLLEQVPQLSILVTSRKQLRLSAEQIIRIDGLPTSESAESDSVKLFVHRARLKAPQFALDEENSVNVIEICRRLGGHPLAVELAAYWINLSPSTEILDAIIQNDNLLVNPYVDASAKQQSVGAILNYTWQQLPTAAKTHILKLSIFRDQFDTTAAQKVCAVSPVYLDALLQYGLVQPHASDWFSLHPLVRAFMRDKFNQSPLRQPVEQAYFTYYLDMLNFEGDLWNNMPIRYAMRDNKWVAQEADLLHAWQLALQHNAHQLLANGAKALTLYGLIHDRIPIFVSLLEQSYQQLANHPTAQGTIWYDRLRVRLDMLVAKHAAYIGVAPKTILARARDAYARALAVEVPSWQIYAQFSLAQTAINAKEFEESSQHYQAVFDVLTTQQAELPRRIAGIALLRVGMFLEKAPEDMIPDWELFLFDHRANVLEEMFEVRWIYEIADLLTNIVPRKQIVDYLEAAVATCQAHNDLIDKGYMTHLLGRLMFYRLLDNEFQQALKAGDELFHLFDQMNITNYPTIHFHELNYSYILAQVGEAETAIQILNKLLQRTNANAAQFHHGAHTTLGNIYFDNGQYAEATSNFQQGLRLGLKEKTEQSIVMSLLQLARIHRDTLPFDLYAEMITRVVKSKWLIPSFRPIAEDLYETEVKPHYKPVDAAQADQDQLIVLGERILGQLGD